MKSTLAILTLALVCLWGAAAAADTATSGGLSFTCPACSDVLQSGVADIAPMKADSETSTKALGNTKAVADKHYIKPSTVLPDVRKAVLGLIR